MTGTAYGLLAMLLATATLQAQISIYNGSSDTNWETPGNWSSGVPDATFDGANISSGETARIQNGTTENSGRTLTLGNNTGQGTLEITNGTLNFDRIFLGASSAGAMGRGRILVSGPSAAATITGSNQVLQVGFQAEGFITVDNSGSFTMSGTTFNLGTLATGEGTLSIDATGTSRGVVTADQINEGDGSGQINFNGGILRAGASNSNFLSNFETGDVTINAGGAFINSNGFDITIGNVLDGTGLLTKQGAGTLTLSGNNTYAGGTTISGGTLQIGSGGTTGSITGNVTNNANLTFNRSDNLTFGGDISGTGSLTKVGAGTLILTGNNTYTGGTLISSGILQVGDGGTTGSFTTGINNQATLVFNRSDDLTFGGSISDTGSLIKRGAGMLTLTANNTYSGGTNVAEGTLSLQHNNAAGTGTIFTTGSVIDYGDGITVSNPIVINSNTTQLQVTTGKSATQSGIISETGGARPLEKIGDGTLTLSGNNTYSGGTTLSAGTLRIGHNNALGTGTLTIENGTTLRGSGFNTLSNAVTVNGNFTVNNTGSSLGLEGTMNLGNSTRQIETIGSTIFGNSITGSGGLTKTGNGTLVFSGSTANTYTGLTTVSAGQLSVGKDAEVTAIAGDLTIDAGAVFLQTGDNQIADSSTVTVNGEYSLDGSTETIQTLLGSGSVSYRSLPPSDNSFSLQSGNFSGTIIEGDQKLTLNKLGTGSLTLSGNNTYSGGTHLQGGTLNVEHNNALGTGTLTIEDGTTLQTLAAPRTLSNNLLINGDFTLTAPIGLSDFTFNGNTDLGGATRTLTVGSIVDIHTFAGPIFNGGLTIAAGTGGVEFSGSSANTYTGLTTLSSGLLNLNKDAGVTAIAGDLTIDSGAVAGGVVVIQARSNQIADTSTLTVNGQYVLADSSETIQTLMGSGEIRYSSNVLDGSLSTQSGNFSGTISEIGGTSFALNKIGTGTLTLSGNNTYSGGTEIDGGTLFVNNTAGSGTGTGVVNVNNGGTLGGSGTITGNVNVNAGGTIAPGNSTGILTVGNLTLNAGSTTRMEINGTSPGTGHDQIVVTGNATLAGTLNLLFGFTPSNGDTFTLIDAAVITGNFDSVVNSLGNALVFTSSITDDYILSITAVQTSFSTPEFTGGDPDLMSIADVLDENFSDPNLIPLINALNGLPGTSLEDAFELINPDELTALTGLTFANARNATMRLGNRLSALRNGATGISTNGFSLYDATGQFRANSLLASAAPTAPPGLQIMEPAITEAPEFGMFVSGSGTFGDYDGDNNGPGYDYDAAAVLAGVDYRLTDNAAIMAYGGYDRTDANLGNNGGTADANTARFGIATTWWAPQVLSSRNDLEGKVFAEAKLGGAHHWYDTDRNALGGTASGESTGTELTAGGTVGYHVRTGALTFGPEASLDYIHLWTNGFTETGSLAPLTVADDTSESLSTTLGGRISYDFQVSSFSLQPFLFAGWRHEYYDTSGSATARFAAATNTNFFTVRGSDAARDSIISNAGVSARYEDWLSLSLGYYGEGSADTEIHSVNGSVTVWF